MLFYSLPPHCSICCSIHCLHTAANTPILPSHCIGMYCQLPFPFLTITIPLCCSSTISPITVILLMHTLGPPQLHSMTVQWFTHHLLPATFTASCKCTHYHITDILTASSLQSLHTRCCIYCLFVPALIASSLFTCRSSITLSISLAAHCSIHYSIAALYYSIIISCIASLTRYYFTQCHLVAQFYALLLHPSCSLHCPFTDPLAIAPSLQTRCSSLHPSLLHTLFFLLCLLLACCFITTLLLLHCLSPYSSTWHLEMQKDRGLLRLDLDF